MSLQKRSTGRQVSTFCFGKHTTAKQPGKGFSMYGACGIPQRQLILMPFTDQVSKLSFVQPKGKEFGQGILPPKTLKEGDRGPEGSFCPFFHCKAGSSTGNMEPTTIKYKEAPCPKWKDQCCCFSSRTEGGWSKLFQKDEDGLTMKSGSRKACMEKSGKHVQHWWKSFSKNIYPVVSIFCRQQSRRWTTSNKVFFSKWMPSLLFFKKYMQCISPLATVISSSLYGCFVPSVSFKPVLATVWCLSAFAEAQYQLFPWSLCWLQFGFQNPRAFMATFLRNLEFSMLFFFFAITVILLFGSLLWLQIGQNHV